MKYSYSLSEKTSFLLILLTCLLFIGNKFSYAQIVPLDPTFNVADQGLAGQGFNNTVSTIVQLQDGKLLVGGNFTTYNGVAVRPFVRLNTDGTLDNSFMLDTILQNQPLYKCARQLPDGRILLAGVYYHVDTPFTSIHNLNFNVSSVCINNDGKINRSFNSAGGVSGFVNNIAVQNDGKILLCGSFTNYFNNTQIPNISPIPHNIIRLNADGTRDISFNPGVAFTGNYDNALSVVALPNGKILVGGTFSAFDGHPADNIVRLNADGSYDPTFSNANTNNFINKILVLPDGKYLVGGGFSQYNGLVHSLVRLNTDGTRDTSFSTAVSFNIIYDLCRTPQGKILVGYDAIIGSTTLPKGIIQLNENGTYDNSLNFGNGIYPSGQNIETVCLQSDNNIVLGGYFSGYNNTPKNKIFRLRICDNTGRRDTIYSCNNYNWNGTVYATSGVYTQTITTANGCSRIDTIQLFVGTAIPTSPSITQTLVSNVCGARVYRYTASTITTASGYAWTLPTSVGGVSGVSIDSGNINYSRIIKVRYASNEASITGDTIRVKAFSGCGQSAVRAAKLSNAKLSVPATPSSITITALQTNVCGARKYRYTAPTLPIATTSATAATGYVWSFIGDLSFEGFSIDSGSLNSQKLVITFPSNAAAVAGDSVRLYYTSACGNSLTKSSKLSNTVLNQPAAPTSITITSLGASTCGQPRYRYVAPTLPVATTTAGAATGYNWSLLGQWQFGPNATIDSGSLTSQKIVIRYLNGNVKVAGDSIRCMYSSACGYSAYKVTALTNTATGNAAPAKPASITIAIVDTSICGGRKYRYTAPSLPAATSVYAAATGYVWTLPATDIGAILDSGTLNSKVIVVRYTNNRAAIAGDSMYLNYTSACGVSAVKGQKLTNLLKAGCKTTVKGTNNYVEVVDAEKNEADVYPNPSNTGFNFIVNSSKTSSVQISIIDMQGRCLKKVKTTSNQTIQLGGDLLPGVYFINYEMGGRVKSIRVIKY